MALNFSEHRTYRVHRLYFLDDSGNSRTAEDVAVRFTTGWISVEGDGDGKDAVSYVIPRERVLRAEGIARKLGPILPL